MSTTIDQDELGVRPIVWHGSGEVIGNRVTVSIRDFDGLFKWFARVEDPGGFNTAETGLATTMDDAATAATSSAMKMLLVWDEPEDEESGGER